jgi:hypothetical protein
MSRVVPLLWVLALVCGCVQPESPPNTARDVDPATIRTTADNAPQTLPVAPHPRLAGEPPERDLTNEDPGLDTNVEAALPSLVELDLQPAKGFPELSKINPADEQPVVRASTFAGRVGKTRERLLKDNGGNEATEKAVADGLAWLAKQQQADGSWVYDGASKEEVTAATGMAVLAFLGAGEAHTGKGAYAKTVKSGLNWLMKNLQTGGPNAGKFAKAGNMYAQAIGALALVEAYGLTRDRALLAPAQAAVNYIQRGQGKNGSWGYAAGTEGDTSICGWQLQAVYAAALAKDIKVDPKVVKNALQFLDLVAAGEKKEKYGYSDSANAAPGTSLTAIGLWSRHSFDKWGPDNPGMVLGVEGLLTRAPGGTTKQPRANKPLLDTYFYYYATQVVFPAGGDDWKDWNEGPKGADGTRKGGLHDWLTDLQVKKAGKDFGSWEPDRGFIGQQCGRLGTTAMCVLTLEVYYRFPAERPDLKLGPKKKP